MIMTLGQKIKQKRIEKRLTQKELADKLHVTFQTISKWEKDENEPDVATLRELSKIFECSLDYLLSEEELVKIAEKHEDEKQVEEKQNQAIEPVSQTIVIHQKELHVCEKCKKDIPEDELEMENVRVSSYHRGHPAVYRQAYYHKRCLYEVRKDREHKARIARQIEGHKNRVKCFGWAIAGGVVALTISLIAFLCNQQYVHPGLGVLYSALITYGIFSMLYCIISGSYIGSVFAKVASFSIKFPGLIFSFSLGGFAWLIGMKILFAILGFLIGVFALIAAVIISSALSAISFPFVLIHNINNNYEDTF